MNTIRFKRNAEPPARAAERRLEPLLYASAWISGFALLMTFTGIVAVYEICLAGALLLALYGLVHRLFRAVQVRLLELAWLVAALGTIAGLCAQVLRDGAYGRLRIDGFHAILMGGCALAWVLGGLTSGLYVAQRLKKNGTWERLGFVALFTLQPVAALGLLFTVAYFLFALPSYRPGPPLWLVLSLLASPTVGIYGIGMATFYKQEARRAERA